LNTICYTSTAQVIPVNGKAESGALPFGSEAAGIKLGINRAETGILARVGSRTEKK